MRNELLGKEEDGGDGSLIMERVMWAAWLPTATVVASVAAVLKGKACQSLIRCT